MSRINPTLPHYPYAVTIAYRWNSQLDHEPECVIEYLVRDILAKSPDLDALKTIAALPDAQFFPTVQVAYGWTEEFNRYGDGSWDENNPSEHTPGPWRVGHEGMDVWAKQVGGCRGERIDMKVCDIRGWGCLSYLGDDKAIAIQKANGRLIAAAPDLLDIAVKASEALDRMPAPSPEHLKLKDQMIALCRKVVKRVKGQS